MKHDKNLTRTLIIGIIGAIITMTGDCLLLGVDYTGAEGMLGRFIISAGRSPIQESAWRASSALPESRFLLSAMVCCMT